MTLEPVESVGTTPTSYVVTPPPPVPFRQMVWLSVALTTTGVLAVGTCALAGMSVDSGGDFAFGAVASALICGAREWALALHRRVFGPLRAWEAAMDAADDAVLRGERP